MKIKNFTERKKRIMAFAGIYAASIILLLFIFSAFGMRFTTTGQKPANNIIDLSFAVDLGLLNADSLLHARFLQLQQSDTRLSMLPDTANAIERSGLVLASLAATSKLTKSIDSIQELTTGFSGDQAEKFMNMLNTFKTALIDRQRVKNMLASATNSSGKQGLNTGNRSIMDTESELMQKDNDIFRLNTEIKSLKDRIMLPVGASGSSEAQKGENELLKTAFTNQQNELDALKERYNRLRTENNTLAAQLVDSRKNASIEQPIVTNNASDKKINMLQERVEELNADLSFAKIDCNLARTDAQQMISNAKQRKQLLSESLMMLTSLSKSDDAVVQKKAKEKIERLNRIATTLHD